MVFVPSIKTSGSIQQWAHDVTRYLEDAQTNDDAQRKAILLEHQVSGRVSRATVDGLLMFDPVNSVPVVSLDGAWEPFGASKNGGSYAHYEDVTTTGTPIPLVAGVWASLTNDGAGSGTVETNLPVGVSTVLTMPAGTINLASLEVGDAILVRPSFTVTPTLNNQWLYFQYKLGSGAVVLGGIISQLTVGAGTAQTFELNTHLVGVDTADIQSNPVTLQVMLSGAGAVVNNSVTIKVFK